MGLYCSRAAAMVLHLICRTQQNKKVMESVAKQKYKTKELSFVVKFLSCNNVLRLINFRNYLNDFAPVT